MRAVCLVATNQFGYHTDHFEWARVLTDTFLVEVVCVDSGRPLVESAGVSVNYVERGTRGKLSKYIRLLKLVTERKAANPIFIIKYFPGCSTLIPLLGRKNVVIDLRTFSVEPRRLIRFMQDSLCRLEAKLFKNIIVVSEELRLKGRFTKASIVGLGGSHIATDSSLEGDSKSLNILYVGAITGRDLGVAIKSIGLLGPEKVELRIAGVGSDKDMDELRSLIRLLKIEGKVELLGYLQSSNLVEHYSWANVGLVHVPPRSYYQCQPSTKLYEYMGAGLHLLVSRYGFYDNKLNQSFATLYDFNESSLAESIVRLWLEIPFKQSKQDISVYVEDHSWDVIVKNQLIPVLDSIGN